MKKIHTVAILGVGAVGSYFMVGLQQKLGKNLWVVASGERAERLKREGIYINQKQYFLNVKSPQEASGADLLLVAVKYGALQGTLEDINTVVREHTIVLSLLNGVDSEEIIGGKIGLDHMIYSLMKIASERKENSIVFDAPTTMGVYFGDATGGAQKEKIRALEELFTGTGVHYTVCKDIIQDIWYKYALNISKNLPQAMVGCEFGAYAKSEHVAAISSKLRSEVVAVAAAKGIDISNEDSPAGKNNAISEKARFSTLQDLDAGRHTEIDMFSGALVRMGRELGIATPYNEMTFHMIKALEEKNDGFIQ